MAEGKKIGSMYAELGVKSDKFESQIKAIVKKGGAAFGKLDSIVGKADNLSTLITWLGKLVSALSRAGKVIMVFGKDFQMGILTKVWKK